MSKTFCKIPFTQISTENDGSFYHCCYAADTTENIINFHKFGVKDNVNKTYRISNNIEEVWNSEFYKKLRKDLLTGIKNPSCNYCWRQESIGAYSHRQSNLHINSDILNDLNEDYSLNVGPQILDIKIGNFCNLKCIMCHPMNSTEHVKEINIWKEEKIKIPRYLDMAKDEQDLVEKAFDGEIFFNSINSNIQDVKEIQFYGGEPLASLEVSKFLERLITHNYSQNIKIKIITNLSILNNKIFAQLENFKEIEMIVSWDHVNSMKSNFIRYPIDYKKFIENFNIIRLNSKFKISISNTISIFNIFDIIEIYDCFENLSKEKHLEIIPSLLSIPKYFNIQYLTFEQKKQIIKTLENYLASSKNYKIFENKKTVNVLKSIDNFLLVNNDDFNEVVQERQYVLELYDTTRQTSSMSLYPYLYN